MAKLHVFDLDHTLLKGNGSFSFGAFLFKKGYLSWIKTIRLLSIYWGHSWKLVSTQKIHSKIFGELFIHRSKESFVKLVHAFVKSRESDLFYPPALLRLKEAKERGDFVAICSSSPDFIVECFAQHLEVPLWCGSKYHVDKRGNFVVISDPIQGIEKVNYMLSLQERYSIPKEDTIAYSDSIRDLTFLRAAGQSIAVQPDKELRRISQEAEWEIL